MCKRRGGAQLVAAPRRFVIPPKQDVSSPPCVFLVSHVVVDAVTDAVDEEQGQHDHGDQLQRLLLPQAGVDVPSQNEDSRAKNPDTNGNLGDEPAGHKVLPFG